MKKILSLCVLCLLLFSPFPGAPAEQAPADLDLSALSPSVAYAQMVHLLREPDAYLGQTLRIRGIFNYSPARQRGVVIVADASGCCEAPLDFVCAGDLAYPGDYPALYTRVTVLGRLERREDGACFLSGALMEMP